MMEYKVMTVMVPLFIVKLVARVWFVNEMGVLLVIQAE